MGFLLYLLLKPLARTPSILLLEIRKCQFLPSPSVLCWRRNQQDDIPGTVIQRVSPGEKARWNFLSLSSYAPFNFPFSSPP